MRFEDGVDRFLLRGIDKRAGVDDEHVGLIRVRGNRHAVLEHAAEHDLGIDQIFCAAEADHADLRRRDNGW